MTRARILLWITLIAGVSVHADPSVTIRLAWTEPPPQQAAVTLHARNATGSSKTLDFPFEGQEASILLPAGQWFISASTPGYWSEPTLVPVTEKPTAATIKLYRATRVRAQVTIPPPAKARTVDVYFNPTDSAANQPSGSMTCPVASGQLDCELPAGLYDLAFRVPGHVSLYKWDVDLRGKQLAELGKLAFRVGATVSGRVELDSSDRQDSFETVKVTLRNASGGDRNDAQRSRESVTAMSTRPNKRGFFSFEVLPGNYIVSAASSRLFSEERQITVIEGREAVLKDPLTLERPSTLVVNVQLPPEGAAQPWRLAITRFDSEARSTERIVSIPADGICRVDKLLPGSYTVELRLRDSVWAAQSAYVDRDTTIDLAVRVMKLRGTVQLGDEPLAATVVFLSRKQGFRIPAQTRTDGTFLVFLPQVSDNHWPEVEVQSTDPWVKRALRDIAIDTDDDGTATMSIRLPAIRIEGVVVDERDRPVTEGLIDVTAEDGFKQVEMSDGTFTIQGLAPGRYALTASAREGQTEEPVFVNIEGESQTRYDVVLRIAGAARLHGSVISAAGPVLGASVFITPANNPHSVVATIPVDAMGEFDYRVPAQTSEILVAVAAPGFSFRMMRMPVPTGRLDLVVDQNGGSLTIDGRVGARAEPFRPYVIHNGAILTGFTAAYLARGRFLGNPEERVQLELPSTEEGTYTLCLLSTQEEAGIRLGARPPESRCVSGMLARHGALALRAPE